MNPTIFLSICSLAYCILLLITLFLRKEKNNAETKLIKILLIVNFFTLLCEVSGVFLGSNYQKFESLNNIVLRLMLILYIIWTTVFISFVLNVSKQKEKLDIKKCLPIYIIMVIVIVIVAFAEIIYNTNSKGVIIYSTGMAVQIVYYYAMACEMICLLIMFNHAKKVKIVNYSALFALVIISTFAAAIQSYFPSLLLSASVDTFVMYIAYINIRNKKELEIDTNKNEAVKNNTERIEK